MRLTLRTLLAYLDNTLEPDDAQIIADKLKHNEFAQGLVQRIQSSMKRLRLGAPKLDGKGMGLDPNTVAEFLNDTLAPERMQEFEKVCLESDVHLAEVAACHQIIALALSEPAEVPQSVRDGIYALAKRPPEELAARPAAAAAVAAPVTELAPVADQPAVAAPRPVERRAEVPDYLRAARRRSWQPILATAALVLLLLAVAMLALGRFDENHPVLGVFFKPSGAVASSDTSRDQPTDRPATRDSEAANAATEDNKRGSQAAAARETEAGEASDAETADTAPPPRRTDPLDTPREPTEPAPPRSSGENLAAAGLAADASRDVVTPSVVEEPVTDAPPFDEEASPPSSTDNLAPAIDLAADTSAPDSSLAEEGDPSDPASSDTPGVGRFIASDRDHVLATLTDANELWHRLATRAVLQPGQHLLVLPSYRPQVALSSGIHGTFVGPARIELRSDGMRPVLQFQWGRALLDTAGISGSEIILAFGDVQGTLTFATADSAIAMEVELATPLGEDPATTAPLHHCRIHVMTGELNWTAEGSAPITVASGQQLHLVPGAEEITEGPAPAWIDARDRREIDQRASRELATLIDYERPLSLGLFEQVGHRQIEVSALAMESLGTLDEFEPMVEALSNDRHHAYWRSYFAALQSGLRRGPESAEAVREALIKVRPGAAEQLYRLLQGYTEDQLAAGGAEQLVSGLESNVMEVRVLALENLRRITDRTHLYRPEREPIQQRKALQEWQTTLSKGLITYERPASATR